MILTDVLWVYDYDAANASSSSSSLCFLASSSKKSCSPSPSMTEVKLLRERPILWSVTRSYKQRLSADGMINAERGSYLWIVVSPDLLTAVGTADKVTSSITSLRDVLSELFVHQSSTQNLESPSPILYVMLESGDPPPVEIHTWCWLLSSCIDTVIPVGTWVSLTADSVLLTCYTGNQYQNQL